MSKGNFLYWGYGSPPCWRVMIALAEKGIEYKEKILSFEKMEHKSPEVLALNPRGQLPTFQLGDVVINDSSAVCDYLEDQYSTQGSKLMPDDPKERALVMQRKHEAPNFYKKGLEDLVYFIIFEKVTDQDVIKERMEAARAELSIWDSYLKQTGAYVAGGSFTVADILVYTTLAYMCRLGLKLDPRYPNLDAYYKRVTERPSVQKTWAVGNFEEAAGVLNDL